MKEGEETSNQASFSPLFSVVTILDILILGDR